MSGTAASSARVYGCCASRSSAAGQVLDDASGVHHQHAVADLGDDGDVVADQEDGDVLLVADRLEQVEHLLLHGDVEGRRRLVGDDERRVAHEPHADHGALAHAARELVRVLLRALLGIGDPHRAEAIDGPRERLLARQAVVLRSATSASCAPMRLVGLKLVIGSWKTIASDVPSRLRWPAGVAVRAGPRRGSAGVSASTTPGSSTSCAIESAVTRLARTRLADDADDLAAAHREASRRARADRVRRRRGR